MLVLTINGQEYYDEGEDIFISTETVVLELEHSLVSLSKWESEWTKPFLGEGERSEAETVSYVKHMTLTPNVSPETYTRLTQAHYDQVNEYINAKMTATWFKEVKQGRDRPVITSEVIYYLMFANQIDKACEDWHLTRLLTLIKVFNEKNAPKKKMNKQEMLAERRRINEERRAKYGTTG